MKSEGHFIGVKFFVENKQSLTRLVLLNLPVPFNRDKTYVFVFFV